MVEGFGRSRQTAPPASAFRLRKAVMLCLLLPAYRPHRKPRQNAWRPASAWHIFCIIFPLHAAKAGRSAPIAHDSFRPYFQTRVFPRD